MIALCPSCRAITGIRCPSCGGSASISHPAITRPNVYLEPLYTCDDANCTLRRPFLLTQGGITHDPHKPGHCPPAPRLTLEREGNSGLAPEDEANAETELYDRLNAPLAEHLDEPRQSIEKKGVPQGPETASK